MRRSDWEGLIEMYSKILISVSSFFGVVGTVYAVLSILKLDIHDIYKTITLGGIDNRDEELLIQREQARLGIPLVVIGWLGQTIFSFIDVVSCRWFVGYLLIFLIIVGILIAVVTWNNKKFREKYKENKNSGPQNTHKELHSWGKL